MLVFWEVTNHTKQLLFLQSSVSRHNHPSFQTSFGEKRRGSLVGKKQHQNDHPNIHWSEIASWCWGPFSKELINSKSWVFFATTNRPEIVFYCGNQNLFGKIKMIIAGGTLLSIPDKQKKGKTMKYKRHKDTRRRFDQVTTTLSIILLSSKHWQRIWTYENSSLTNKHDNHQTLCRIV